MKQKFLQKKVGLALGSGGVKGLAHIGVIKALLENDIPIDYIAGSSIGALIGAHFAAEKDIKNTEKIALETSWKNAIVLLDPGLRGGIIKGDKTEKLIKQWLNNHTFDSLKIPLTVIATDLLSGQEVDFSSGNLINALRASISVPPIFQPVKFQGYLLCDGGLTNPLPDDIVSKMGAQVVITVNLDSGKFMDLKNPFDGNSMTRVSIRALNILRHQLAKKTLTSSNFVIEPDLAEIGLVGWNRFFDSKQVKQIVEAGYTATLPIIKPLIKSLNK